MGKPPVSTRVLGSVAQQRACAIARAALMDPSRCTAGCQKEQLSESCAGGGPQLYEPNIKQVEAQRRESSEAPGCVARAI